MAFDRLSHGGSGLIQIPASDSQQRLEAILADAEEYFARARVRAWAQATADIDAELAARADARRTGNHDPQEGDPGSGGYGTLPG